CRWEPQWTATGSGRLAGSALWCCWPVAGSPSSHGRSRSCWRRVSPPASAGRWGCWPGCGGSPPTSPPLRSEPLSGGLSPGSPIATGLDFDVLNRLGSWRASTLAALGAVVPAAVAFWRLAPRGVPPAPQRALPAMRNILAHPILRWLSLLVAVGYTAILAFL